MLKMYLWAVHDDADIERTSREMSRLYDSYTYMSITSSPPHVTYDGRAPGPLKSNEVVNNAKNDVSYGVVTTTGHQTSGTPRDESVVKGFHEEAGLSITHSHRCPWMR